MRRILDALLKFREFDGYHSLGFLFGAIAAGSWADGLKGAWIGVPLVLAALSFTLDLVLIPFTRDDEERYP